MTDPKMSSVDFRTSSYSGGTGECVEVGSSPQSLVVVRDSKDTAGFWMEVSSAGWQEFVGQVKTGSIRAC